MKHIKCCKCGDLLKPKLYIDHFRRCLPEKANHSTDETDVGSQTKRQKISDDSEHVSSVGEENSIEIQRPRTTSHREDMEKSSTDSLKCSNCEKLFTRKNNLARHQVKCGVEKIKKTEKTACGKCKKSFSDYRTRLRHEKNCFIDKKYVNKNFTCATCGDKFSCVKDLTRHERQFSHNRPGASGSSIRTPPGTVSPGGSESSTSTPSDNTSSATVKDISQTNPSCRLCGDRFANYRDLYHHRMVKHKQSGSVASRDDPWAAAEEIPPWQNEDGSENARLRNVYDQHRHLILRERELPGQVRTTYNFPVPDVSNVDQLMEHIEFIFDRNQYAFKLNLSFGIILQNINTQSYRYFAPHYTDQLFLFPELISSRRDIERIRVRLAGLDLSTYFQKQKPNSKWKPVLITNVLYAVHKTSFPLGLGQPIPSYILNSKSIITFANNPMSGKRYSDNLCFFRCLAYHKYKRKRCETLTADLHSQWLQYVTQNELKSPDVTISCIPDLELCFNTNINVFELSENEIVTMLYKSREVFSDETLKTMNLNLFEDHLSYISKFNSYASKFQCRLCQKLFDNKSNLVRHEASCQNATKLRFPGGYFSNPKSIFDRLKELGISVEASLQNFPWFLTFDMEAMLKQTEEQIGDHLTKISRHEPVSVSISSNVDGFTDPKFILDQNLDNLLDQMIGHMNVISEKAFSLARLRWQHVFTELEQLESKWTNAFIDKGNNDNCCDSENEAMESAACEPPSAEFLHAMSKENVWNRFLQNVNSSNGVNAEYNDWEMHDNAINADSSGEEEEEEEIFNSVILPFHPLNHTRTDSSDSDDDDSDDDDSNDSQSDDDDINQSFPNTSDLMKKLIKRTREDFETYCHQLPVLGFNSARYDLNLLKTKLAKHLKLHEPKQQKFVVKKNNSYMCLSNPNLRFLDMINYLPPGTSYSKFLSTFGVSQKKSFFPYEYFTDFSILDEKRLPPKECFFSSLKQCNTLEDKSRVEFEKLVLKENKTESEALAILKLNEVPASTISINYDSLLMVWEENNMHSIRDFLEYYNNLDTLPMIEAVEKFKSYFADRGVDVFKDCISVPGAARKKLYNAGFNAGASFALIDKVDKDLYQTIKSNIVGGPSIIFTRYHEVGKTNIREDGVIPCKSVLGYDANSLYIHAISQPMPCGNYIRRRKENNFKPTKTTNKYTAMFDWMEWLNHSQNLNIKHKMNTGNEKRIGPYLVDGFDSSTGILYEFFGCYFHSHSCITPKDEEKEKHKQRFKRTEERLEYLRNRGYEIVCIWECEYRIQLKENNDMLCFIEQRYPSFYRKNKRSVNESEIIDAIVKEELFGFVEVDIRVPDSWSEVEFKPETNLTPFQYFEEMCPLFCTTEVEFDSIGEHMQSHAEKYDLSTKPRTLLVGGMKAERILLSSPLLKWYIEHGLLVTNIHQVVEFSKLSCFKDFVDTVTNDRREGDIDKSQQLKSSLSKLIGNSAFGGTIINQEKFQKIKYMEGFKKACFAVNNPRFKQLTELGDDMFESEFANSNISINSPVQLGYMILQYAKLHMLSFYFDFLIKFVGREKFEMVEMDTDSCYFGLAEKSLKECIRPELLPTFEKNIAGNCKDDFTGDQFQSVWFPRECCEKHNRHDTRTPGLMKLEFRGTKFIGLCSKSYIAINCETDDENSSVKYSLKGINNQFMDPSDKFSDTLKSQNPSSALNRGIRCLDNAVFTYIQPKQAFNYFYCKRQVLADGIHTKPLDIVLKPINKYEKTADEGDDELKTCMDSTII